MKNSQAEGPSFNQIAAFFGICVWLVPFGLFVSLSAGELVLPTIGSDGRISPGLNSDRVKKAQGLVKQVYAAVGNWVTETMQAFGYGEGRYISARYR
jgi:Transmembrane adaptor Erv26